MKLKNLSFLFASIITMTISSCGGNTHSHSYKEEWSYDEAYHWHDSSCGHETVSDKGEHVFSDTIIDPTYESGGYTLHKCTICEYSYKDNFTDPLIHHYSEEWGFDENYHWHSCTDEGYKDLKGEYNPHLFSEWIIDVPPTPDMDGVRHHECLDCGFIETERLYYVIGTPATRVYVDNLSVNLFKGLTYKVSPNIYPVEATKHIQFEIVDSSIVSVENGQIKGLEVGNSLVYVYNDNNLNNVRDNDEPFTVMNFNIKEPDPNIIINIIDKIELEVGESKKISVSVTGASASGLDYGYYSEDESICTFSGGKIVAHKVGATRVSASWQGYRGYATVYVKDKVDELGVRASEIKLNEEKVTLNVGDIYQINYELLPSDTIDFISSIRSNNSQVVSVDENGLLTAHKGGSAIITFKTSNDLIKRFFVLVRPNNNDSTAYYDNYYGDLSWENSSDLKTKLREIISKNVTPLKYNSPNWESNQFADQDLYDYDYVKGVYSDTSILKSNTQTGWQREHAFAATLMTGYSTGTAVKALGRSTDFHNLFAASAGANGSRGNKNFGYSNISNADYVTIENCAYTKKAWEPDDSDKGRLARAIFYMSVMYSLDSLTSLSETWTYRGTDIDTHSGKTKSLTIDTTELGLQLINDNVDYTRISLNEFMYPENTENIPLVEYYRSIIRSEYPDLEENDYDHFRELAYERYLSTSMPYSIGHLDDLLLWNSFAVDHLEVQHNESVYSYYSSQGNGTQGNRNPFVDYPELVNYLYGDLKDTSGSLKELTPTYLSLEMDKDEIHHYALTTSEIKTFEVGDKPTVDDFHIKAIKNDLSVGTLDKSKIIIPDYTFTEEDVSNGKLLTIETDKNDLTVLVKVISENVKTFDTCSFSYRPSSGNKADYSGSGTSYVATFKGEKFDVTFGKATSYFINKNPSPSGVTIGSGNSPVESIEFISQKSYTDVDAIFFIALTNKDLSIPYKIYVGDTLVNQGNVVGNTENMCGTNFNKISGKVRIYFSNVVAMSFCGLAVDFK